MLQTCTCALPRLSTSPASCAITSLLISAWLDALRTLCRSCKTTNSPSAVSCTQVMIVMWYTLFEISLQNVGSRPARNYKPGIKVGDVPSADRACGDLESLAFLSLCRASQRPLWGGCKQHMGRHASSHEHHTPHRPALQALDYHQDPAVSNLQQLLGCSHTAGLQNMPISAKPCQGGASKCKLGHNLC